MKRREFLVSGAGGMATVLASGPRMAKGSTPPLVESHRIGDFEILRTATGIAVRYQRQAARSSALGSETEGSFLDVEQATAAIDAFGRPEGAYQIRDTVSAAFGRATITGISAAGSVATLTGELSRTTDRLGYRMTFEALSTTHLRSRSQHQAAGPERSTATD